jgi:hypothetical protein
MRPGNGLKILISLGPFFDEIEAIILEREPQELGGATMSCTSSSGLDGLILAITNNQQTVLRWQFQDYRLDGLTLRALHLRNQKLNHLIVELSLFSSIITIISHKHPLSYFLPV